MPGALPKRSMWRDCLPLQLLELYVSLIHFEIFSQLFFSSRAEEGLVLHYTLNNTLDYFHFAPSVLLKQVLAYARINQDIRSNSTSWSCILTNAHLSSDCWFCSWINTSGSKIHYRRCSSTSCDPRHSPSAWVRSLAGYLFISQPYLLFLLS